MEIKPFLVGVLCFQGGLHYLSIDSRYLPPNPEVAPFQINVLPFEAQKLSPSQPSGQLQVVEFKYAALPGFPQEGLELLHWQGLYFSVFHFRQGTALGRVGMEDPLLLG